MRVCVCICIVSTYLSLSVAHRGKEQKLRIKQRVRERQDYTHGGLESSRAGRKGWEEKVTETGLRLQRRAPFVAGFSCDGLLVWREGVKESFSERP